MFGSLRAQEALIASHALAEIGRAAD